MPAGFPCTIFGLIATQYVLKCSIRNRGSSDGRYGEPEDLAVYAVFLASPLACYITGTVTPVDGGLRRYQN